MSRLWGPATAVDAVPQQIDGLLPAQLWRTVTSAINEPPVPLPDSTSSAAQTSPSHSKSQSLYQCAECLRRYSRPEHLHRHIATHTLGKRFVCDICSKAFARADLLKRHRLSHQDDNGTKRRRVNSFLGPGRVAHACQACARARVKCEELKPCSRCKNRGLNCEYPSSEDAARHLLHLSESARNMDPGVHQDASPVSTYDGHHPPAAAQPTIPGPAGHRPLFPDAADSQAVAIQSSISTNTPWKEEPQLLTPETLMHGSNPDSFQPPYPNSNLENMHRMPFSDFLRDVLYRDELYEQSLGHHARFADAQGLAVLDVCDDGNLELNEVDFGLLDHWNIDGMSDRLPNAPELQSRTEEPRADMDRMRKRLVQIWTKSPWRWNPENTDNAFREQSYLPLSSNDAGGAQVQEYFDRVVNEKLHLAGRDKILTIVLGTCRNDSIMSRVASSFPSTEVMDSWIHIFLASHLCQVSTFIHYPSFSLDNQWPEWLAIAASAGAVLAPVPTLRRFGFALQEAVRVAIPKLFEENNRAIADISPVQALMLVQDIGLWSGNRRKMEIAEGHLMIPITMMRYRGKFQGSHYPQIIIDGADEGKVLEEKWKRWYELECWKRLVFHAYLRDAQISMTQFINPSMSYAELTLPLPSSKKLWFAKTAEDFKTMYLEMCAGEGKRAPSLTDLFRDVDLLVAPAHRRHVDMQLAFSIYLHGFWSLIWEYRQLRSVGHSSGLLANPNILLNSRHQELYKALQHFPMLTSYACEMPSAQENLVLNLLQLNLHVSLDDLQLFSGKEGEEQARRVYPVLQKWSQSPEAWRALLHAGQILRHAKLFPACHLKDFYAIAVHHAALCLWTHGVVTRATGCNSQLQGHELVHLDGNDSDQIHRFTAYGHGRAAIRGPDKRDQASSPAESLLEDPRGCMEIAQEILRANFIEGQECLPPISENIIHLLKQLGNAARAVGPP